MNNRVSALLCGILVQTFIDSHFCVFQNAYDLYFLAIKISIGILRVKKLLETVCAAPMLYFKKLVEIADNFYVIMIELLNRNN